MEQVHMRQVRNTMQWAAVAVGLGLSGAAAAQATEAVQEPEAVHFGQRGQVVLDNAFFVDGGYTWVGTNLGFFTLQPSADLFVLENLSVGVTLSVGGNFTDDFQALRLGAGVRTGYALPLAERISLWPRLSASVFREHIETDFEEDSSAFVCFELFAPILVHPTRGFFIGVGPAGSLDVGDREGVTLGVHTLLGGVF
jgi:hypothetical protein